ncbi:MAG: hypothetical protein IT287_04235 [Bdellovibrionaceae bacterium]|nr:hypothetical protein [Pseudobdellovibrionaceae bacterium]
MKFKIPSKTFLLGEYLALAGGPALLMAHGPYFECEFAESQQDIPFHPDSPAGIWVDIHEEIYQKTKITFKDPHGGSGGFGASTAQFIATYLYVLAQQKMLRPGVTLNDLQKWAVLEDYRNLFEDEEIPPSGYDVLAQLQGGLSAISATEHNISSQAWPFDDVEILLYKTKTKINTHDHLKKVKLDDTIIEKLEVPAEKCAEAFINKNSEDFFAGLKEFSDALEVAQLIAAPTRELIKTWTAQPEVLCARGCGALGADVFAAFVKKGFVPTTEMTSDLQLVWTSTQDQAFSTKMEVLFETSVNEERV